MFEVVRLVTVLMKSTYLQIGPPVEDVDERLAVDDQRPVLRPHSPSSSPRRHLTELLRRRRHRARLLALPILDLAQVVPDRRLGRVTAPSVQLYDLHVLENKKDGKFNISSISTSWLHESRLYFMTRLPLWLTIAVRAL